MTDDLREALTKIADKWDASVLGSAYAREVRALLAAHPAPDTRREEEWVEVAGRAALDSLREFGDHPTISYRESGMIRAVVRAVLAVLPVQPVVASGTEDQRYKIRHAYAAAGPGDYVQRAAHFDAVMAPPVVDEEQILDCMTITWAAHIGVGDPVTPLPVHRHMAAAVAARLRGATRG